MEELNDFTQLKRSLGELSMTWKKKQNKTKKNKEGERASSLGFYLFSLKVHAEEDWETGWHRDFTFSLDVRKGRKLPYALAPDAKLVLSFIT